VRSQALQIIFDMHSQRSSQKRALKKICFFVLQNAFFFHFFFSFWPLLFNWCITFSFFVQIEWFKLLWNHHLKFYKSCWNSKSNIMIFKDFLRGLKIGYELFDQEFSVKMIPLLGGGGHNFLTCNPYFYF